MNYTSHSQAPGSAYLHPRPFPVVHTTDCMDYTSHSQAPGYAYLHPRPFPVVYTQQGNHIRREDETKALPDEGQDDIEEGGEHKQHVQGILLLWHALLGTQGGDGEHP